MFINTLILKRALILIASVFLLTYIYAATPPGDFPRETSVMVEDGDGLYVLAEKLKEDRVIRSPFWFRFVAIILGGERGMQAGQYYLPYPQSTITIAWRVASGDYRTEKVKLTIPEGYTTKKISSLFDERFANFDHEAFEASNLEGYLFPDTYFFPTDITATGTIQILRNNFNKQLAPFLDDIESSGRTFEEVIIMASIIEGEASGDEDREVISGILWKRLDNLIALQVDVAPETYQRRGLPDKPINNPGLLSIRAALEPKPSPYLYYLHDPTGQIHYARTFEDHITNKRKYLN